MRLYKNSWQVCYYSEAVGVWMVHAHSVGNKSYATGYLNALLGMIPRRAMRLYDKDGLVKAEHAACKGVHLNSGGAEQWLGPK